MRHVAMIILNAHIKQEFRALLRAFPPRHDIPLRPLTPTEFRQDRDAFLHDRALLFDTHRARVLVRVSVQPNFVAGIPDRCHLFWEGLETVSCESNAFFELVKKRIDLKVVALPGMNQVVLIPYLSNNLSSRRTPTSPAYIP